jgi:hypothetical protein
MEGAADKEASADWSSKRLNEVKRLTAVKIKTANSRGVEYLFMLEYYLFDKP